MHGSKKSRVGDAALLDLFGSDYVAIVPLEELILGTAASF
jgi:hypothetical protein